MVQLFALKKQRVLPASHSLRVRELFFLLLKSTRRSQDACEFLQKIAFYAVVWRLYTIIPMYMNVLCCCLVSCVKSSRISTVYLFLFSVCPSTFEHSFWSHGTVCDQHSNIRRGKETVLYVLQILCILFKV